MRYWLILLLGTVIGVSASAQAPRVLDPGTTPADKRTGKLKTLNDHFPFIVPNNAGAWYARAEQLRRRVRVATGLWPMPEKPPLNAVIYGKSEHDGFTLEKVYFESLPGHFVTGLLFRPSGSWSSPSPGVLSPHGHGGRMQRHSEEEIKKQIAQGAEHFVNSGQTPKLARCVQLARMGCVTFIFDMLGYADSIQIPHAVSHRHKDSRPEELEANEEGWIFYSPEADLRLQSIMGLQTWNAIRSLDFLASLPDVDPERLAVTGGSGGGTQTILLGAIDERVKVSFPNGMVSTSMQGGCYCENCNLLRVGTGNVELAALFAPKPQAMTAADDWTRDMMSDGYPELKWIYAMIGDEADVYCRPMLHFKHNYNYVTRATMYQWMNRHLELGLEDPVIEKDFEPFRDQETTVWSEDHPAPNDVGIPHERKVCRWFDEQATAKLEKIVPADAESLKQFRRTVGRAWQVIFDQELPEKVGYESKGETTRDQVVVMKGLVRDETRGAELPLLTLRSANREPGRVVIWSTAAGKASVFDDRGAPGELLAKLLEQGATVMLPDLLQQGELNPSDGDGGVTEQRLVEDERSYSAFTFGYNRSLVAHRSADLLTVVAHAISQGADSVALLATDGAAPWAAPAAALAGNAVDRVVIATDNFRFADIRSYKDANFVPGAVKYGDLPVLLAFRAPGRMTVVGETDLPTIVQQTYSAAESTDHLRHAMTIDQETLDWLLPERAKQVRFVSRLA